MRFSINIATKDRLADLTLTLENIKGLLTEEVECVVIDDGSSDGTFDYVKEHFPNITIHRNAVSKGYISCRNKMLNETKADYVISLDDDAHFLSENPLQNIESHFLDHPECGLIAFRLFWGKLPPETSNTTEKPERVKSFVGCGHAWRMSAWRNIPDYPEWFKFYGEENFAALQLFKKNIEVHYQPQVLVQHRVDLQRRKQNKSDFNFRFRNALRADWYLYFLFYPLPAIPRKMAYSVKTQLKTKILKNEPQLLFPLLGAVCDTVYNIPNLRRHRNVLTTEQFSSFMKLKGTKIFWKP